MRVISCKQCFNRKYAHKKTFVPTIASGLQVNALECATGYYVDKQNCQIQSIDVFHYYNMIVHKL